MAQLNLFAKDAQCCECSRCGARCKVNPVAGSRARMLRHSVEPKGLCVNCAVHNWLRNTYPVNLLLARSGPKGLALPHIQRQFAGIMRAGFADARPDEINWALIIDNWDLPFPTKLKRTAANPVTQKELDREAARTNDESFLTDQERRAKAAAQRDHAIRDFMNIVNPASEGKSIDIRDDIQ